jgi:phosphatidylglycerophosphate synthase
VGELYNEVPDRVSDTAILIGLGLAAGSCLILGYGAALAAMFTAYVRTTAKAAGAPMDFCGPMAKQHRMFVTTLTCIYLAASPASWRPTWQSFGLPAAALALITFGSVVTALRRLHRAARALREKKA